MTNQISSPAAAMCSPRMKIIRNPLGRAAVSVHDGLLQFETFALCDLVCDVVHALVSAPGSVSGLLSHARIHTGPPARSRIERPILFAERSALRPANRCDADYLGPSWKSWFLPFGA